MTGNPYQVYRKVQVQTADPGTLILMLYDGAMSFLDQARDKLEKKDYAEKNRLLMRAYDVVAELLSSLNMDAGPVARSLSSLYDYILYRIVVADVNRDPDAIQEVINILSELRGAWERVFSRGMNADRAEPRAAAMGSAL